MRLTLPLNFGERQCDRLLLSRLKSTHPDGARADSVQWLMFLIWKDFGIARDDRREVPLEVPARAGSDTVLILEQYCGWWGAQGAFVEAAIATGFFNLVPIDAATADLILVDFFPANHSDARDVSNSARGGIRKGVNLARRAAESDTKEQLHLFLQSGHSLMNSHNLNDLKLALLFVHQVCNLLRRPKPSVGEWQAALVVKALDVLAATSDREREAAFQWFVKNRASQEIPLRLDFVIDGFPGFVEKGVKLFGLK
jgi:hypothetical protein